MIKRAALFLSLCAWTMAPAAHAQSGPPARDSVTIGIGIGLTTSYDGGRDYRLIPGGALFGTVSGHDFRLNGPQLFIDAIPNAQQRVEWELGPVVGVDFNRTGDIDNARVEALGELKTAVELGARASVGLKDVFHRTDKLAFAMTAVRDVAQAHRSFVLSPSLEYARLVGRSTYMRVALTSEFVGEKWADYNFGISADGAAASGFSAYDPDGGLASVGASLLATRTLSGKRTGWSVFGLVNYKHLAGDIADSPLVQDGGSPHQFFLSMGLGYSF